MNKLDIQAVFFDLDGVLVDACEWHYRALNKALSDVLGYEIPYEEHLVKYNGLPTAVKLHMLGIEKETAIKIENIKQDITLDIIKQNAKVMPEKQLLHQYLKDKGIKIGCVTNSIKKTATAMLQQTGQYEFMDLLISNEDIQKNKPFPDCYDTAVKKLMINPFNCLCVEDSPKGIQAAKASCIPNLWVVKNPSEVTIENFNKIIER